MNPLRRSLAGYALAVPALALATVIRWAADPYLGDHTVFYTYFAAVALVGLFAGLGPAVFTLVAGGLIADFFFIPPRGRIEVHGPEHWVGLIIFCVAAGLIIALTERLRAGNRRLEESKQEAEARGELLQRITDSVPMLLSYVDRDLRYEYVSAGYEKWFQKNPDTIRGRHLKEVLGEQGFRQIEPYAKRALAGEVVDFENEIASRSGRRLVRVQYVPDRRGGRVRGFFAVITDLTERQKLAERDARLAAIVKSSQEAILTKDLNSIVTSWNPGAEKVYGYTAEEMIGTSITKLTPPERAQETLWITEESREGRAIDAFETVRAHKDGHPINILLSTAPIRDTHGKVVAIASIERDITRRKQAEEALRASEERFRTLADNISQFAWMADANGWIFWYNKRWYDYTGTTLEEMQGWGWTKVHHPDFVDGVVTRIQHSWDTGEPWEDLFPMRGKDGQYRWFLSRALPIRDDNGNVVRWFGTNTDVTEQRAAEEALREADRRKDQFLSMLAHELRNPLAPIVNAVQVLHLHGAELGGRVRWAADVIDRQARHLVRMVDDLLDLARINTGRIQLRRESVEIAALVSQSVENLRPRFTARNVNLEVSLAGEPLPVEADPGRIVQIIDNLLDNAAKYTDQGGRVCLELRRDGDDCVLCVRDTGIGIDSTQLPRIFDLFEQVDTSLDRSAGGLGLGLNLAKHLVEMHGGNIQAHSEGLGRGSEFVVRLPLARDTIPSAPDDHQGPQPTRPQRVLVIEDNADVAKSVEILLQTLGHDVRVAANGGEGIALAEEFRPDLALIDIGLPDMDGYDVARALRARFGNALRLVAVTGYGQEEHRKRSKEAGFDEHLLKPASKEALGRALAGSAA